MVHTCSHCVSIIFPQPTQQGTLYYFRRIYTIPHLFCRSDLFIFQKFCTCVDDTFLVPNESGWQSRERFIYFCRSISRFISLVLFFFSTSVALNIFSFYQLSLDSETFFMSLFGCSQFWAPTRFPEVICPGYSPACTQGLILSGTL